MDKTIRFKKLSRWNVQPAQSNRNEIELMKKAVNDVIDSHRPLANEGKHKRGKTVPTSIISADKVSHFHILWEPVIVYELSFMKPPPISTFERGFIFTLLPLYMAEVPMPSFISL